MTPARVLAVLALVLLASASVALAAGRVALVVGNSTYAHIARLPNPENDAADMAAVLQRLGFDVTTAQDANRASLNEALRVFTRESVGADMALVFYAGHGLEMDGVNYLVPVDARLERDTDVRFETVALDDVLAATAGASLRMVILDACRNNPLARSMQRTVARRSVSGGSLGDLNEDLLGDETLVPLELSAGNWLPAGEFYGAGPCSGAGSSSRHPLEPAQQTAIRLPRAPHLYVPAPALAGGACWQGTNKTGGHMMEIYHFKTSWWAGAGSCGASGGGD